MLQLWPSDGEYFANIQNIKNRHHFDYISLSHTKVVSVTNTTDLNKAKACGFISNKSCQMTAYPRCADLGAGSGRSPMLRTFTFKRKLIGSHIVHYMLVGSFCFRFFDGIPVLSNSSFSRTYSCLHSSKNAGSL